MSNAVAPWFGNTRGDARVGCIKKACFFYHIEWGVVWRGDDELLSSTHVHVLRGERSCVSGNSSATLIDRPSMVRFLVCVTAAVFALAGLQLGCPRRFCSL